MNRILVPYDFSDYADSALDFAVGLSKKNNAEIHVLNVIEPRGNESFDAFADGYSGSKMEDVFMIKLIDKLKKDLLALKDKRKGDGIEVHLRMGAGIPETIVEYAESFEAEVIVMGTLGSDSTDNQVIGSVAQKVARKAPCPVISVTEPVSADIKHIIFASDFEDIHKGAMERMKSYRDLFGAELHLLRVCTPTNFENTHALKDQMEKVSKDYGLNGATLDTFNDFFIEDGILNFASDYDNALICLTTEGRTGFARLLTHSIAEDVVNHASKPVLTINTKTVK